MVRVDGRRCLIENSLAYPFHLARFIPIEEESIICKSGASEILRPFHTFVKRQYVLTGATLKSASGRVFLSVLVETL